MRRALRQEVCRLQRGAAQTGPGFDCLPGKNKTGVFSGHRVFQSLPRPDSGRFLHEQDGDRRLGISGKSRLRLEGLPGRGTCEAGTEEGLAWLACLAVRKEGDEGKRTFPLLLSPPSVRLPCPSAPLLLCCFSRTASRERLLD